MIYFALSSLVGMSFGFVAGSLWAMYVLGSINLTIKQKVFEVDKPDGEAQFFEAVSDKEKFEKADNITDILHG